MAVRKCEQSIPPDGTQTELGIGIRHKAATCPCIGRDLAHDEIILDLVPILPSPRR
jgi:hypothetical protein